MSWPVVDRAPVQLPTLPGHDDALWATLAGGLSRSTPGGSGAPSDGGAWDSARLRRRADPAGKLANAFTHRVLGY